MYGGQRSISPSTTVSASANQAQLAAAVTDADCSQSSDLAGIYFRRPGQLRKAARHRQPAGPERRGQPVPRRLRQGAEKAPGAAAHGQGPAVPPGQGDRPPPRPRELTRRVRPCTSAPASACWPAAARPSPPAPPPRPRDPTRPSRRPPWAGRQHLPPPRRRCRARRSPPTPRSGYPTTTAWRPAHRNTPSPSRA